MITIRPAAPADAEAIINGINFICREGGAFYATSFAPSQIWQKVLYHSEDVPDHLLVVVEWSGTFAGCGRLFPFPKNTLLNHVAELGMFLLPPYRGKGHGHTLLHFILNWAKQQPLEKITLQVFSTNSAARNLYRSAGFVEEGILKEHLKQGQAYVDFIQMSYWL
jgi:RimJ/RimL family protein N-acetyltransferase